MYPVGAATVLSLIALIWLAVLTFLFFREKSFLRKLFPKTGERDIRQKFKEVLDSINGLEKAQNELNKRLSQVSEEGLLHLQKVEVLRYNPYNDTGGDQSFTVGLLDGKLNGMLVTSLHSRAGTRVYTKIIKNGKSDLELSKEEKQILAKLND